MPGSLLSSLHGLIQLSQVYTASIIDSGTIGVASRMTKSFLFFGWTLLRSQGARQSHQTFSGAVAFGKVHNHR